MHVLLAPMPLSVPLFLVDARRIASAQVRMQRKPSLVWDNGLPYYEALHCAPSTSL